jgi:hypothetical protein
MWPTNQPIIRAVALTRKGFDTPGLISPVFTEKCIDLLDQIL